jgi:hypothetical protein
LWELNRHFTGSCTVLVWLLQPDACITPPYNIVTSLCLLSTYGGCRTFQTRPGRLRNHWHSYVRFLVHNLIPIIWKCVMHLLGLVPGWGAVVCIRIHCLFQKTNGLV